MYDNSGNCVAGVVQPSTLALRERATRTVAFPGLNDEAWKKLQGSPKGQELIKQADALRIQQQAARKELGDIKNSPAPYKQKADQMIAVRKKLEDIGAEIGKMQEQATTVIEMH